MGYFKNLEIEAMDNAEHAAYVIAAMYVRKYGKENGHKWVYDYSHGLYGNDLQAFNYIAACIDEAVDDYLTDPSYYNFDAEKAVRDGMLSGMWGLEEWDWMPGGTVPEAERVWEGTA